MLNFMNQPNQQLSFANGCLSVAEWAAAALNKLQNRGVLDFDRAMWQLIYILIQVQPAAMHYQQRQCHSLAYAAALGIQGQRLSQTDKLQVRALQLLVFEII